MQLVTVVDYSRNDKKPGINKRVICSYNWKEVLYHRLCRHDLSSNVCFCCCYFFLSEYERLQFMEEITYIKNCLNGLYRFLFLFFEQIQVILEVLECIIVRICECKQYNTIIIYNHMIKLSCMGTKVIIKTRDLTNVHEALKIRPKHFICWHEENKVNNLCSSMWVIFNIMY